MIAAAPPPSHASIVPALVLLLIVAALLFGAAAILAAWADERKRRRRNVLVACTRCGRMYPEDPQHPGWADLHVCYGASAGSVHDRDPRTGPDAETGHQRRMDGDDE